MSDDRRRRQAPYQPQLGNRGWIITRKRLFRSPLTSGVGEAAS